MAKPKSRLEVAAPMPPPAPSEKIAVAEKVYVFPPSPPCPRCKCSASARRGQYGDMQYRVCAAPICRYHFAVKGKLA